MPKKNPGISWILETRGLWSLLNRRTCRTLEFSNELKGLHRIRMKMNWLSEWVPTTAKRNSRVYCPTQHFSNLLSMAFRRRWSKCWRARLHSNAAVVLPPMQATKGTSPPGVCSRAGWGQAQLHEYRGRGRMREKGKVHWTTWS